MGSKELLKEYHKKRNFDISAEPFGEDNTKKKSEKKIFVIQKHKASNLHYDLRLSVNGVLKSWAVPKGPSMDPKVKRLAIQTEDHPFEYADFEGSIPENEYGGGVVMVWDAGTYDLIQTKEGKKPDSLDGQIKNGHVKFILNGKKLQGGFALVQTSLSGKKDWLLIKMEDEKADARRNPTSTQNKSVLTGRTMNQIKKESSTNE